jgi:hypothetical protein
LGGDLRTLAALTSSGSQVGSQRRQAPGDIWPHPAKVAAAKQLIGPRQATPSDGWSVYGMQEVRGSNPLSSTQVKNIIRNPAPTLIGQVQQRNTATQRHDVPPAGRDLAPPPSGSCWHGLLKPATAMVLKRPDQEECSVRHCFDSCRSASARRLFAGDSCRLRNSSRQLPRRPAGAGGPHARGQA